MPNHDNAINLSDSSEDEVVLLNLKTQRRPSGLEITLHSDIFEEYFRTISNDTTDVLTGPPSSHRFYMPRNMGEIDGMNIQDFPSDGRLIHNGIINMIFIRAQGISRRSGVTFVVPTVISNRQLKDFNDRFEHAAVAYYAEYIQPSNQEIRLVVTSTVNR